MLDDVGPGWMIGSLDQRSMSRGGPGKSSWISCSNQSPGMRLVAVEAVEAVDVF